MVCFRSERPTYKKRKEGLVMKRREFLKYSAVAAAGTLAGASGFPIVSLGASNKPIKIGLMAPLTGVLTDYGTRMEKGARLAVEVLNDKGGILGRKIDFLVEDDKTEPPTAALKAKKLVFKDKVDFLMGTISSATTLAAINAIKGTKVPYFWIAEGEDKNCVGGDKTKTRKYIFGVGPTPEQKYDQFVPYMLKNFGKSFYFVGSDYVFPHFTIGIGKDYLKKHGGVVAGEEYGPLGTTDWSAVITRIERAKPDVLFSVVVGTDGIAFVKQSMNFGLKEKMIITGFPSFGPSTYGGIRDYAEGIYTPISYTELLKHPENTNFVKLYKARYNPKGPISDEANGGWTTIQFIKAASEKAGTTNPDKFVKALEGLSLMAPQGKVEINAGNHTTDQHIYLCKIKNHQYHVVEDFGTTVHPGHSGCSA
jgi:urea transport system substrate-binding protein